MRLRQTAEEAADGVGAAKGVDGLSGEGPAAQGEAQDEGAKG